MKKSKQIRFTQLCQLNGGCMGCCGHDFISKEKIKLAIKKNTLEFEHAHPQTEIELLNFRDREHCMNLRSGVCRNLIEKDNQIFCPLHPDKNKGKDLRIGHCDINHLCKTAQEFESWEEKKQEQFLTFIKNKTLDNIDYSMAMDKNLLLKEFEQLDK